MSVEDYTKELIVGGTLAVLGFFLKEGFSHREKQYKIMEEVFKLIDFSTNTSEFFSDRITVYVDEYLKGFDCDSLFQKVMNGRITDWEQGIDEIEKLFSQIENSHMRTQLDGLYKKLTQISNSLAMSFVYYDGINNQTKIVEFHETQSYEKVLELNTLLDDFEKFRLKRNALGNRIRNRNNICNLIKDILHID